MSQTEFYARVQLVRRALDDRNSPQWVAAMRALTEMLEAHAFLAGQFDETERQLERVEKAAGL